MSGAKVIERNPDAHFLEHLQGPQNILRTVFVERMFGDFQLDEVVRNAEHQ
ncbi:hypothetical protein D3C80_2229650 [compost metagenome]